MWNASVDSVPVASVSIFRAWISGRAACLFQTVLKNVVEEKFISVDTGDTAVASTWYDRIGFDLSSWADTAAFWVS